MRLEREISNTELAKAPANDSEPKHMLRAIAGPSETRNRREINISGCISLRELQVVRVERLELPRLAAPEPKSGVSTNFTIPARECGNPVSVDVGGRLIGRFEMNSKPENARPVHFSGD